MTSAAPSPEVCPQCQGPILAGSPCPRCSLRLGRYAASDAAGAFQPTRTHDGGQRAREQAAVLTPSELAERFPQYEVLNLIGRGGMGTVYRARQKSLDRMVAIKTIQEADDDPTFAERFSREARTLARLSHPNIVTIHDFGHSESLYFLVMEYVDGVNLRQAINAQAFDPGDALRIVGQVCDALQYAHAHGVVHRDIKPENILITETGNVKIADFGLAKLLDDDGRDVTLTNTKQVMGTLAYMAPEQIDHSKPIDHRADIYSLGVVFYELLTGHLPLGRFEPPSHCERSVDNRIDPVVMKTLSRMPDERYQAATDLGSAVEALSSDNLHAVDIRAAQPSPHAAEPQSGAVPPHKEAAWSATATTKDASSESATASIPFSCDCHGGMSKAHGLMHLDEEKIRFEWRVKILDWIEVSTFKSMGWVEKDTETVTVPWTELNQLSIKDYLLAVKLKIGAKSLGGLGNLPTCRSGNATLSISRSDEAILRAWIRWFDASRRSSAPTTPNAPADFASHDMLVDPTEGILPLQSPPSQTAGSQEWGVSRSRNRGKVLFLVVLLVIVVGSMRGGCSEVRDRVAEKVSAVATKITDGVIVEISHPDNSEDGLEPFSGEWVRLSLEGAEDADGETERLSLKYPELPIHRLRHSGDQRTVEFAVNTSTREKLQTWLDSHQGSSTQPLQLLLDDQLKLVVTLETLESEATLHSAPLTRSQWDMVQAIHGRYQTDSESSES